MSDFIYSKGTDNIVLIQWDMKDKNMNVLTLDGIKSLRECVNRALDDEKAIGIIIGSGKKDFSGGMDLNILQSMMSKSSSDFSDVAFKTITGIHELLRKIELAGHDKRTKKASKTSCLGLIRNFGRYRY
jgi:3-hydroxyacyl-CoA dehydrogenase/enoyl-CoA hydratase/3-hydroxybutyryl-CoA epimerase